MESGEEGMYREEGKRGCTGKRGRGEEGKGEEGEEDARRRCAKKIWVLG